MIRWRSRSWPQLQHGVIAARQLYSLGLSETQVRNRAMKGWLHRVHRGVYTIGGARLTDEGRWLAAVLACGNGSILSHQSAGELWGLRRRRKGHPVDVTIPHAAGRRPRAGLAIHRASTLQLGERTLHCRIPVTTPARTILDLASLPTPPSARAGHRRGRATEHLHRRRPGRDRECSLRPRRCRCAPRRARRTSRRVNRHSRNDFEERFLALCRRHRLPQPDVNVPLLDYVVDFLWPQARLVVELDGRATHGTHRAFQADRDRDGRLSVAGYRVLRFTWFDVTRRPAVVADRVRRMLATRA